MGTQYVIDSETMEKIADPLRSLAGRTDDLTPAEMEAAGNAAVSEVDDQTALLAELEAVLSEKATPSGGEFDLTKCYGAWVYGGIMSRAETPISFVDGMTWGEFCASRWNAGFVEEVGPVFKKEPFLVARDGRIYTTHAASVYLVQNDTETTSSYTSSPKSNDIIITPEDKMAARTNGDGTGVYYWFRM